MLPPLVHHGYTASDIRQYQLYISHCCDQQPFFRPNTIYVKMPKDVWLSHVMTIVILVELAKYMVG